MLGTGSGTTGGRTVRDCSRDGLPTEIGSITEDIAWFSLLKEKIEVSGEGCHTVYGRGSPNKKT
eukprot:1161975-Pelagomonas_calceolata.AAC.14